MAKEVRQRSKVELRGCYGVGSLKRCWGTAAQLNFADRPHPLYQHLSESKCREAVKVGIEIHQLPDR